jgi:hypothetical protein
MFFRGFWIGTVCDWKLTGVVNVFLSPYANGLTSLSDLHSSDSLPGTFSDHTPYF